MDDKNTANNLYWKQVAKYFGDIYDQEFNNGPYANRVTELGGDGPHWTFEDDDGWAVIAQLIAEEFYEGVKFTEMKHWKLVA